MDYDEYLDQISDTLDVTLSLGEDKKYSIKAILDFIIDDPEDEGELFFINPVTKSKVKNIKALSSKFKSSKWNLLIDKISLDTNLKEKIWNGSKSIVY